MTRTYRKNDEVRLVTSCRRRIRIAGLRLRPDVGPSTRRKVETGVLVAQNVTLFAGGRNVGGRILEGPLAVVQVCEQRLCD